MGNDLFGANISGKIAAAMGPLLASMTVSKTMSGTRTPSDPSAGTNPVVTAYPCKGILDDYSASQFDGTIIKRGDRKALILGDTLPAGIIPEPSDLVGAEGATFTVVAVKRDPDAATYLCQVR